MWQGGDTCVTTVVLCTVIPPKLNRKAPPACALVLIVNATLVKRFFNLLKHFRAVATRNGQFARNFLAGARLAVTIFVN